jgi:protein-S-isoprenylcysteine O-methyltransferase Ste14
MITFLKIFLPIYFLLFFGLAMFWRSYIAWKRTGINPYKLGNGDTVHDFVGKLFRLTLIATALIVFVFSFLESVYDWLFPNCMDEFLRADDHRDRYCSYLALIWVLVAQIQMGDSWRIGIDEKSKSALVQHGLFGVSRNPIFLGMLVMLVGCCYYCPTAATLVTVLGFVLIHVQVRLEEAFLIEKYGEDYRKYQMSVRRWI